MPEQHYRETYRVRLPVSPAEALESMKDIQPTRFDRFVLIDQP
jgi:hypothetical protein